MTTAQAVAQALLKIKAVGFTPDKPITFKSGIISPVYVDNRRLPFNPEEWHVVMRGFDELIKNEGLEFDVIAGIETAGIPHSAALSFVLNKPSVFVRKGAKDHGTKKMIEGGDVKGKKVLLIEDHVTTGGSSLAGVRPIRDEGGTVTDCLAVTSYEFAESNEAFEKAEVKLHTLTSFSVILDEALKMNIFGEREKGIVEEWLKDPHNWGK